MSGDAVKRQWIEKRATAWTLLDRAASAKRSDPQRGYDTRYQQPDVTYEKVLGEASLAAQLASRCLGEAAGLDLPTD